MTTFFIFFLKADGEIMDGSQDVFPRMIEGISKARFVELQDNGSFSFRLQGYNYLFWLGVLPH
jgi:hypothetical protein